MAVDLPPDASNVFDKRLTTENYAREVLRWPNGRLAKLDIFSPVDAGSFGNLDDCAKHFVTHLGHLFKSSPPKQLLTHPNAFLTVSKEEMPSQATLVLTYKSSCRWQLEHRSVPVHVELGRSMETSRFGDETEEDVFGRYARNSPTEMVEQDYGMSGSPSAEK
ncbi:hypothetical protein ETB97_006569 [Aspergillus alliaceus]|uniref:Uncharacterized protein n=1 Tax=Petromyces alliaceus TaxID=209559 RepID=A0A8H6ADF4_PETAA|nr:hypothetical protein ETB97_006569 [Aspergillus burnettii]